MDKPTWLAMTKEQRFIVLREKLQLLVSLCKEEKLNSKEKKIFKKTHNKYKLEDEITNYIKWDNE